MSEKAENKEVENAEEVEEVEADLLEEEEEEEEESDEATADPNVLVPGRGSVADPYHAIMLMDEEGENTGQLWTFDGKIMLFESRMAAQKVLDALKGADDHWELRGVTAAHLQALRGVAIRAQIPLFVVVGFTPKGKIEAMPLGTHDRMAARAGTPPPLPPKKAAEAEAEGDEPEDSEEEDEDEDDEE